MKTTSLFMVILAGILIVTSSPLFADSTPVQHQSHTFVASEITVPAIPNIENEVSTLILPGPGEPITTVHQHEKYKPIVTLMDISEYKEWKPNKRYAFKDFIDLKDSYEIGEQIAFYVAGMSDDMIVEEENGFNVVATIFDPSNNFGQRANVTYDSNKQAWKVKFATPSLTNNDYKIVVNLFCEDSKSQCASTFGFGTQINKIVPVQIH